MRLIDSDSLIKLVNDTTVLSKRFKQVFVAIVNGEPTIEPERPTEPQIIHCKDCKYFDLDHWANIHGIPLIVAHEICTKWGDGCKTKQDGYCFMAERRTDETIPNNS